MGIIRAVTDAVSGALADQWLEVIEPDQDFVAIGSGGNFAYAAANGLFNHTEMTAEEIVRESLRIASSICVYTNDNISVEKL